MTPTPPPAPSPAGGGPGPVDPVLAGLARELDGLRRTVAGLEGLPGRVDELAGLVAQLADALTALSARKGPTPCPSWLTHPTSPIATTATLEELGEWLRVVYLRYPDAASGLPECWLWHPDVVEELLWLEHAWLAAYQGRAASVGLAGDWHDRQRPGVVRRIRQTAGSCSRERHQTRAGWDPPDSGAPTIPGADAVAVIAAWWGGDRDHPAPEPQPDLDHVGHLINGRPA
jgi:hypothetical protein